MAFDRFLEQGKSSDLVYYFVHPPLPLIHPQPFSQKST